MKTSRILKLAMVGCAVAAMAACTRKPPVETGVPGPNDGTTQPTGPAYPTAPTGPVTGAVIGAPTTSAAPLAGDRPRGNAQVRKSG